MCLRYFDGAPSPWGRSGWGFFGYVSGAIAHGYASGRLLAHDKLEGATCHDVGIGDVVLLILFAVEQSGCVVIRGVRRVGRSGLVVIRGV